MILDIYHFSKSPVKFQISRNVKNHGLTPFCLPASDTLSKKEGYSQNAKPSPRRTDQPKPPQHRSETSAAFPEAASDTGQTHAATLSFPFYRSNNNREPTRSQLESSLQQKPEHRDRGRSDRSPLFSSASSEPKCENASLFAKTVRQSLRPDAR